MRVKIGIQKHGCAQRRSHPVELSKMGDILPLCIMYHAEGNCINADLSLERGSGSCQGEGREEQQRRSSIYPARVPAFLIKERRTWTNR